MAALEPSPDLRDRSRSSRDSQSAQQHHRSKSRRISDRRCSAAHKVARNAEHPGSLQRGDPVNVYSQSASSWLVGEVVQINHGKYIQVQYKIGDELLHKWMHVHSCDVDIPSAIRCSVRPSGAEPRAKTQSNDWGMSASTNDIGEDHRHFPIGANVKLRMDVFGGFVNGCIVKPECPGYLTVEMTNRHGRFRKHVLPSSGAIDLQATHGDSKVGRTRTSQRRPTRMQRNSGHGEEDVRSLIGVTVEECDPGAPYDQSDADIVAVHSCRTDASKSRNNVFKSKSKFRYMWILVVDGEDCEITFDDSIRSGMKRVWVNREIEIDEKTKEQFHCHWLYGDHCWSISPRSSESYKKDPVFELSIDNKEFDTLERSADPGSHFPCQKCDACGKYYFARSALPVSARDIALIDDDTCSELATGESDFEERRINPNVASRMIDRDLREGAARIIKEMEERERASIRPKDVQPVAPVTEASPSPPSVPTLVPNSLLHHKRAEHALFLTSCTTTLDAKKLHDINKEREKRNEKPLDEYYNAQRFLDLLQETPSLTLGVGVKDLLKDGIQEGKLKPLNLITREPIVTDHSLNLKKGWGQDLKEWVDIYREYSSLTKYGVLIIAGNEEFLNYWRHSDACKKEIEEVEDNRLFVYMNDVITLAGEPSEECGCLGHIVWRDGSVYVGGLHKGVNGKTVRQGNGTQTESDGTRYSGRWVEDVLRHEQPQSPLHLHIPWDAKKAISIDSGRPRNVLVLFPGAGLTEDDLKMRCENLMGRQGWKFTHHHSEPYNDCGNFFTKIMSSKDEFIHLEVPKEYPKDKQELVSHVITLIHQSKRGPKGHPCQGCFVNSGDVDSNRIINQCEKLFGCGYFFQVAGWERWVPVNVQETFFYLLYNIHLKSAPTTLKEAVDLSREAVDLSSEDERLPVFVVATIGESDACGASDNSQEKIAAKVVHDITLNANPNPSEKILWDNVVQAFGQPEYWQNCLHCASLSSWVEVLIDTYPKMFVPCVVTQEAIISFEKELRAKLKVAKAYIRSVEALSLCMHPAAFFDLRGRWQDIEISTPDEWGVGEVMISEIALGSSLRMQFTTSLDDSVTIDTIQNLKEHLSTTFHIHVHDDIEAFYPGAGFPKRSTSASTDSGLQIECQSDLVKLHYSRRNLAGGSAPAPIPLGS